MNNNVQTQQQQQVTVTQETQKSFSFREVEGAIRSLFGIAALAERKVGEGQYEPVTSVNATEKDYLESVGAQAVEVGSSHYWAIPVNDEEITEDFAEIEFALSQQGLTMRQIAGIRGLFELVHVDSDELVTGLIRSKIDAVKDFAKFDTDLNQWIVEFPRITAKFSA